jgi:hypothetical protein
MTHIYAHVILRAALEAAAQDFGYITRSEHDRNSD